MKTDIHQADTDQVIEMMEAAGTNWVKPFAGGTPMNAATGNEYRGIIFLYRHYSFLLSTKERGTGRVGAMMMQLEDALECTVTRKEAIAEIMKHDFPIEEFFDDVGDRPEYRGSEVLLWLGY